MCDFANPKESADQGAGTKLPLRPLGARALGGGDLTGSRIVKIAYVDEAGAQVSDAYCVVAGVIIDPDKQYQQVRARLDEIKHEHAAYIDGDPHDLIFHAKDIYHGTKRFHRDRWPFEIRMHLLELLAGVINDHSLPFVVTAIERAAIFKDLRDKLDEKNISSGAHAVAYGIVAMALESYMRQLSADEMAQMVCENNNEMRSRIKSLHSFLAAPGPKPGLQPGYENFLPIGRIIDTVHFVEKTGDYHLDVTQPNS
jgi:hypothetical protein